MTTADTVTPDQPDSGDAQQPHDIVDGTDLNNVLDAAPKTALAKFDPAELVLQQMEAELAGYVPDFSTKAGEKKARDYRTKLVKLRAGAETLRKEIQAPWLKAQEAMMTKSKDIAKRVAVFEDPIDKAIKAIEAERAAEKARQDELDRQAEAKRLERIAAIRNLPSIVADMTAEDIAGVIEDLAAAEITEERFGPHVAATLELRAQVGDRLTGMHSAALQRERREVELQVERDRLEQQRRDNARREEERLQAAAIDQRINEIRMLPLDAMKMDVDGIRAMLADLATPSTEQFGADRIQEASHLHLLAKEQITQILSMKVALLPQPAPEVERPVLELTPSPAEPPAAAPAEPDLPIRSAADDAADEARARQAQVDAFPDEAQAETEIQAQAAAARRNDLRVLQQNERQLERAERPPAPPTPAPAPAPVAAPARSLEEQLADANHESAASREDFEDQSSEAPADAGAPAEPEAKPEPQTPAPTAAAATMPVDGPSVQIFRIICSATGHPYAAVLAQLRALDFDAIQAFIDDEEIPL